MSTCAMRPADRRRQIRVVGNDLIKHYGKKRHYTVEQVRSANRRQGVAPDYSCWSHAFFNDHQDFDALHQALGEACDYLAMRREVLADVAAPSDGGPLADLGIDLDLSWLELPEIDLSIFEGLGDLDV